MLPSVEASQRHELETAGHITASGKSAKRDERTHAFSLVLLSSVFLHVHAVPEPPA